MDWIAYWPRRVVYKIGRLNRRTASGRTVASPCEVFSISSLGVVDYFRRYIECEGRSAKATELTEALALPEALPYLHLSVVVVPSRRRMARELEPRQLIVSRPTACAADGSGRGRLGRPHPTKAGRSQEPACCTSHRSNVRRRSTSAALFRVRASATYHTFLSAPTRTSSSTSL